MIETAEKRGGPDRRSRARGGRRSSDKEGLTPLIMVVDHDPERRDLSHAILARLKFAVAPVDSIAQAAAAVPGLEPELIVASEADAPRLIAALGGSAPVRVVAVNDDVRGTDAMVESIRRAIRQR
jgi:DNA-binding NtrC family response regulator